MARFNCVTVLAPAKLNLALDVVGLLPGGYHDLDMTMQAITLYERVVLRRSPYLDLRLPGSLVAPNDKNTAIKAALAFFDYTGLLAGVDTHFGVQIYSAFFYFSSFPGIKFILRKGSNGMYNLWHRCLPIPKTDIDQHSAPNTKL